MKVRFFIYCLFLPATVCAQTAQYYNWSGFPLAVYAQPSVTAAVVETIPVGGAVKIAPGIKAPAYTIYLSYYGDTSTLQKETAGEINNTGSFYPLKTPWVRVEGKRGTGYVPLGFLSHIPYKTLYKKGHEKDDREIPLLDALKVFFGKPLSFKKQELEKQSKDEIHFLERYQFPGKITYSVVQQYVEKDGPGGEEHKIFLPNTSLHEAVLFLLEITRATAFQPEERKSVNKIKSRYDFFSWWYQPNQYNDAGEPVSDKNRIGFEYGSEGGSASAIFILKDQGVEIIYAYGGC